MAIRLIPRGPFSLAAAASFAVAFPGTDAEAEAGGREGDADGAGVTLSWAWAVDSDWRTVRVTLRENAATVHGEFSGSPAADLRRNARRDVERILSLDSDATGFQALGRRDPVVAGLQREFPGLRPVLFFTPYEAAVWTLVSHRIRRTQAARITQRIAEEIGEHGAFPAPQRLREMSGEQRGLTDAKIGRLRELADAAIEGRLDRDHLRSLDRDDALAELQELSGIGPFSAELILIRGAGDPDVCPAHEPRVMRALRAAYHLSDDADPTDITDGWRPFRSWVSLLLRARLSAEGEDG